jgi:hypothetical protein
VLMSWDSRSQRRAPVGRAGVERFGEVGSPISAADCRASPA